MFAIMSDLLQPGQRLARGVSRHLIDEGFTPLLEFSPTRGLRVDVLALGPKGEIWVIECKSSRADFQSDAKWQGYLDWCDRFYWCVSVGFPTELLPPETGLILADDYGAQILRHGPDDTLPAARRKALTLKIARTGLTRLQHLTDALTEARLPAD